MAQFKITLFVEAKTTKGATKLVASKFPGAGSTPSTPHIENGVRVMMSAPIRTDVRKSRAVRLSDAQGVIEDGKSAVEELRDEMQEWYGNMPENLQGSSKGEEVQETVVKLKDLCDCLEQLDFDVDFPGAR